MAGCQAEPLVKSTNGGWLWLSDGTRAYYRYAGNNPNGLHQLFGTYDGPLRIKCVATWTKTSRLCRWKFSTWRGRRAIFSRICRRTRPSRTMGYDYFFDWAGMGQKRDNRRYCTGAPVCLIPANGSYIWCRRRGSNPHSRKENGILSPARLPVPPLRPDTHSTLFPHSTPPRRPSTPWLPPCPP